MKKMQSYFLSKRLLKKIHVRIVCLYLFAIVKKLLKFTILFNKIP